MVDSFMMGYAGFYLSACLAQFLCISGCSRRRGGILNESSVIIGFRFDHKFWAGHEQVGYMFGCLGNCIGCGMRA